MHAQVVRNGCAKKEAMANLAAKDLSGGKLNEANQGDGRGFETVH
jgi:hypothetical protein